MRNKLWSSLTAISWCVTLLSCHAHETHTPSDERLVSNTYTIAKINITYEDEHEDIYTDISESGKYGEGIITSAGGVAVHVRAKGPDGAQDHSGCTWPLLSTTAPDDPLPTEPWVAVIKRGSCTFEIKVQNALRANAAAVLIYNDRDSTVLEKMKLSTDSGRNISAVFTYKWTGEDITRLVDNGTRVDIGIIPGRTFTNTVHPINKIGINLFLQRYLSMLPYYHK